MGISVRISEFAHLFSCLPKVRGSRLKHPQSKLLNGSSRHVFEPFHDSLIDQCAICLQSKATGVVVDFTDPTAVYDNVKQVSHLNAPLTSSKAQLNKRHILHKNESLILLEIFAFHFPFLILLGNSIRHEECSLCASDKAGHGDCIISFLRKGQHGEHRVRFILITDQLPSAYYRAAFFSLIGIPFIWLPPFICQGCLVAPTLSIGSILLQQAAISASFHYKNVEIVESRANARVRRPYL